MKNLMIHSPPEMKLELQRLKILDLLMVVLSSSRRTLPLTPQNLWALWQNREHRLTWSHQVSYLWSHQSKPIRSLSVNPPHSNERTIKKHLQEHHALWEKFLWTSHLLKVYCWAKSNNPGHVLSPPFIPLSIFRLPILSSVPSYTSYFIFFLYSSCKDYIPFQVMLQCHSFLFVFLKWQFWMKAE